MLISRPTDHLLSMGGKVKKLQRFSPGKFANLEGGGLTSFCTRKSEGNCWKF